MEQERLQQDLENLENKHGKTDLGKIFPELIELYQEEKKKRFACIRNCLGYLCGNNKVEKLLLEKNILFQEQMSCLFASGFSSQVPVEYFLEEILRRFPRIQSLKIWNSDLSSTDFFKKLAQTNRRYSKLLFCYCNIGNSLAHHLSLLQVEHMQTIVIQSDPISNKGVKLLIKMNLTGLQILCLTNVNITADIFKVMKKLVSRSMNSYVFQFLPLSNQVIKETLDLIKREQPTFLINISIENLKNRFIFLNILAKVHLSQTSILNREVYIFPRYFEDYDPFTSPKVTRNLSQVLNYIPQ